MPGICVPAPTECPAGGSPVCGCDGVTYASDCARLVAGVTKVQDGACSPAERVCSNSNNCPEGTFCEFPTGNCGEGLIGVCMPMHNEACTVCSPYTDGMVCGCDGNTYANDCQRAEAGVSAWFPGSCTP